LHTPTVLAEIASGSLAIALNRAQQRDLGVLFPYLTA
jgi:hypothetical protein